MYLQLLGSLLFLLADDTFSGKDLPLEETTTTNPSLTLTGIGT